MNFSQFVCKRKNRRELSQTLKPLAAVLQTPAFRFHPREHLHAPHQGLCRRATLILLPA